MFKRFARLICFAWISVSLSACGGGESSQNNGSDTSTGGTTQPPSLNYGGQPSNPANASLSLPNVISNDASRNYFKINVSAGDKIVVNIDLEEGLRALDVTRCLDSSSSTHAIIESVGRFCSYDFVHTFVESGTYTLRFEYPLERKGVFYVALLSNGIEYSALPANGNGGTPTQPRLFDFSKDNVLTKLSFFNNYQYIGLAGDKLIFHTMLNAPLASNSIRRCRENNYYSSLYTFGVSVNLDAYSCAQTSEYILPKDGKYNFNLRFISVDDYGKVDGSFRVTLIR